MIFDIFDMCCNISCHAAKFTLVSLVNINKNQRQNSLFHDMKAVNNGWFVVFMISMYCFGTI